MNEVKGIQIREIAVYHPKTERDKEYYIKYYGAKGDFAKQIMEDAFGRDKRFVIDPDLGESSITIAIEAAKKVLVKAGLTGKDIDMICFSSNSPEYVSPPGALLIHNAIGAGENAFAYDLNATCVGMAFGFEQLSKYMTAASHVKRALLVGAECLSQLFSPEDMVNYVCYGDAACAVILEKTEDMNKIVDSKVYVQSQFCNHTASPKCGLLKTFSAKKEDMFYTFNAPEIDTKPFSDMIKEMLAKHHLMVEDVKMFCTSQFAKPMGAELIANLGAKPSQWIYVGDQFGYTGANSPFISMNEAIEQGVVKRGDYIVIWTLGASVQYIMTLIRY